MTLIVCLDDQGGMLFNKRRQSRDRVLCERVLSLSADAALWVSRYSAALFEAARVCVDDDYATQAQAGDYVFVEDGALPLAQAQRLIVYRWNRRYPADRLFPCEQLSAFTLTASAEFVGSSHDRITEEFYTRL